MQKKKLQRPTSRHRGVILAMVILGLALLAGLVLYVLNLGRQVNARVVTQNASDAAAAGGAGWVARSFNNVAMNNAGITQLIGAVQVLDGVPLATQLTLKEQNWLYDGVNDQLKVSFSSKDFWIRDGLMLLRSATNTQINDTTLGLKPLDQLLNHSSYEIGELTMFNGPNGRGAMWQAMISMDQYSQTLLQNLGVLAQLNAIRSGEINFTGPGENGNPGTAMLVPVVAQVPWKRGHVDDFERPVKYGMLPGRDSRCFNEFPVAGGLGIIDDKVERRGPFDTIYGWRDLRGSKAQGYFTPGDNTTSGGKGNTPLSGNVGGNNGTWTTTGHTPPTEYRTYGTLEWSLRHLHTDLPRFDDRLRQLSQIKLSYLWPGPLLSTGLWLRGYAKVGDATPQWEIPMNKDYHFWFDGSSLKRTDPASYRFYLEDGVNDSSNDVVLDVRDQRDGTTKITYISEGTNNWQYDVLDGSGNVVFGGLGEGVNGKKFGMSITIPTPVRQIIDPNWVTDFSAAAAIAANPTTKLTILETQYAVVEVKSKLPYNDPNFGAQGTWAFVEKVPRVEYLAGWWDARTWGIPQPYQWVWRDEWQYTTNYDNDIGIPRTIEFNVGGTIRVGADDPQATFVVGGVTYNARWQNNDARVTWTDANGPHDEPLVNVLGQLNIPHWLATYPVHRVDAFVFLGVNNGKPINVRNPNNYNDIKDLPSPSDFDHAAVKSDAGSRWQYLTFLAAAKRSDAAPMWETKFDGGKPYPNMVAITQAQVFNNHSFDLWTQMWNAQVEAVVHYDSWLGRMNAGAGQAGFVPALDVADLADVTQYLSNARPLAQSALTH